MRASSSTQILSAGLAAGGVGAFAFWHLRAPFLGMQLGDQLLTLALCVYSYAAVATIAAIVVFLAVRPRPSDRLLAFAFGPALWAWLAVYMPLQFQHRGPLLSVLLSGFAALALVVALSALARRWPVVAQPQPYAFFLLVAVLGWLAATCLSPAARQGTPAHAWLWPLPALTAAFYGLLQTRASLRARSAFLLSGALGLACVASAALVAGVREPAAAQADPATASHVVLLSIDTLRADHLGCYGNPIVKTPSLDALARESVLFENTISAIPLTNPSHTTMLTGVYPGEHRVEGNAPEPIQGGHPTLPRLLAARGFETAGFVSSAVLDQRISRLHRRFQTYDDNLGPLPDMPELMFRTPLFQAASDEFRTRTLLRDRRRGDETVSAVIDWLARNAHRRFFLFVHLYDPHGPYAPPPPYDRMYDPTYNGKVLDVYDKTIAQRSALLADPRAVRHMKAAYSGEVTYADSQVGRLVGALRREGILDDTLLIVTSDHGESLGEHGYYFDHSLDLHDPSLKVPLLMRLPSERDGGTRVSAITSLVDITPTVLDVTGTQTHAHFDGVSLLGYLHGGGHAKERYVYSILFSGVSGRARMLSVRSLREKYIHVSRHLEVLIEVPGHDELYSLLADPGELHNLADRDPAALKQMVALGAPRWRSWFGVPLRNGGVGPKVGAGSQPVEISPDVERALKRLGYVQ